MDIPAASASASGDHCPIQERLPPPRGQGHFPLPGASLVLVSSSRAASYRCQGRAGPSMQADLNPRWAELHPPLPKRSCCWGSWAALRLRWGRGEEEDSYPWAALPGTRERPGEQLGGRHKWTVNITTCTPRTLRHVSSEESNGTGRGWARSLPSTPGAPSPRRTQDRQRHQHHQSLIRGGSYRLRLWETSP